MIIWHMLTKGGDYIWVRPALLARKFRRIELKAGLSPEHAKQGAAYDYNIPEKRAAERCASSRQKTRTPTLPPGGAACHATGRKRQRYCRHLPKELFYYIRVCRLARPREVERLTLLTSDISMSTETNLSRTPTLDCLAGRFRAC